jgi:hypothetical protein
MKSRRAWPSNARLSEPLSLVVPEVEALDVERKGSEAISQGPLHYELTPGNGLVACLAQLTLAEASPGVWEAVHRQGVIDEFAADENTESFYLVVHWRPFGWRRREKARITRVSTPAGANPKRPGAGRPEYTLLAASGRGGLGGHE